MRETPGLGLPITTLSALTERPPTEPVSLPQPQPEGDADEAIPGEDRDLPTVGPEAAEPEGGIVESVAKVTSLPDGGAAGERLL